MINTLLGTKVGMTSSYDSRGRRVGATMVKIEPNFVTQVKNSESKDGYEAIQIGTGDKKNLRKPQIGHAKKAGVEQNLNHLKEIRIKPARSASFNKMINQVEKSLDGMNAGQKIELGQVFFVGDSIKVTATSKGKGFQGVVKRHGFHGGPKTHGQSDRHRAPGSIGSGTTPGRVYKGKSMAGHMGVDTVSYTGLEVVGVDKANGLLTVKGGIPGAIGALVILEKQGRVKGYEAPPEEKEDEEEEGAEEESNEPEVEGGNDESNGGDEGGVAKVEEEGEENGN
jgi:large subunit ribosomal protein L3